jgi:RNA polymerase sigma factor (sigma-70 family)
VDLAAAAADQDARARECLRRVRQGDHAALGGLIDAYGEPLMRYLTSILRDPDRAADAFQDTWVRVIREAGRFDPARPFAPWLFRIARNRAYDELRRGWRRRVTRLVEGWGGAGHGAAPPGTPVAAAAGSTWEAPTGDRTHDMVAAREIADRLLPLLDPDHREVICLRYYNDLGYEDMAAICGVPVGTIKSRLRRALDRLAALYAGLEGGRA